MTVDAGPTAVQHLCDARGWTIQGQTRYLRLLTESDDGTPPQTAALHLLDAADFPTLTASLDSAPSLTALGGWYTLDWECALHNRQTVGPPAGASGLGPARSSRLGYRNRYTR
ncbi:MAG: hypothetical protein HZY76_20620 [Anaerolineae bacterium]|nr:MAG: hypothetical protein HZY76_20620 [Anaerolineae bacterium]